MKGRNLSWAAAAVLALGAALLSPALISRFFSVDHQLAGFVVLRLHILSALAALAAAVLAAAPFVAEERRARALAALAGLPAHPLAPWLLLAAVAAFLFTELNAYEWHRLTDGFGFYAPGRVARGEVPCRDLFTLAPPGFFYWISLAFRWSEHPYPLVRFLASVLPKFLCAATVYGIGRMLLSRGAALAACGLTALFLSQNPSQASLETQYMALLFSLVSLACCLRHLRSQQAGWLCPAGVAAALAAAFRQDFGLYILAVGLAGLVLASVRGGAAPTLRSWAWFLLPWGLTCAVIGAGMAWACSWQDLLECYALGPRAYMSVYSSHGRAALPLLGLWEWLSGGVPAGRGIYFLGTRDLGSHLGALAVLGGAWAALRAWRNRPLWSVEDRLLALLVVWCGAFYGYPVKGGAFPYVGVVPVAILILLRPWERRWARLARAGLLGYCALVMLFFRPFSPPPGAVWLELPAGRVLCPDSRSAADLKAAVALLQEKVPPGGTIFVFNQPLHDNYAFLYGLAGRKSATRFYEMMRGITTAPEIQQRIVDELERNRPERIVDATMPWEAGHWPESDVLRRYIETGFAEEAVFGEFRILKRKG